MRLLRSIDKALNHHYAGVAAYILLAIFVAYAFTVERRNSDEAREKATQTFVAGCERNNEVRSAISDILDTGIIIVKLDYDEGQVSKKQYIIKQRLFKDAQEKVALVDCSKAFPDQD